MYSQIAVNLRLIKIEKSKYSITKSHNMTFQFETFGVGHYGQHIFDAMQLVLSCLEMNSVPFIKNHYFRDVEVCVFSTRFCFCVGVCVRMRAYVCICVRVYVYVCVCVCL